MTAPMSLSDALAVIAERDKTIAELREAIEAAVAKLVGSVEGPLTPFQRLVMADILENPYEASDVHDFMALVQEAFDAIKPFALSQIEAPKGGE